MKGQVHLATVVCCAKFSLILVNVVRPQNMPRFYDPRYPCIRIFRYLEFICNHGSPCGSKISDQVIYLRFGGGSKISDHFNLSEFFGGSFGGSLVGRRNQELHTSNSFFRRRKQQLPVQHSRQLLISPTNKKSWTCATLGFDSPQVTHQMTHQKIQIN